MNSNNANIIHYKIDMTELLDIPSMPIINNDTYNTKNPDKEDKEDITYKIRIEEHIKIIKDEIYKLFEKNFKNKNDVEKIIEDLEKINKDIEEYKKITNERIEKIFKLLMITNEKLVKLGL